MLEQAGVWAAACGAGGRKQLVWSCGTLRVSPYGRLADGSMIKAVNRSFQEFVDAIWTADDEQGFESVARRVTRRLGFRWFAYLQIANQAPTLVSSYPKAWTSRYFELGYQQLDPVVRRARHENDVFCWGDGAPKPAGTRQQRNFFDEAMTFGIRSGVTVPIKGGFGRMAAFTLATDEPVASTSRLVIDAKLAVHLVGLYFHTHAVARLRRPTQGSSVLTQRERQCLAWVAQGKTVADIAVLVQISRRTVVFHLENARRKLDAATIAQCVGEALRRGLLP
ncbi:autoinducer binding domain-containing protein [Bradyrhizobium sp. INPA03-11B]|uniref:autoinducer binding domain-containing protein n=1 Tax=Bradyrhizobium sp. INPA03-11B TaxID=418598 RepID=UPI0033901D83